MDRNEATTLGELIQKKVSEIPGYKISLDGGTFNSISATYKVAVLDASVGTSKDARIARYEHDFVQNCEQYGFRPSDLGKRFFSQGVLLTIVGLDVKSRRRPIVARAKDNRKGTDRLLTCPIRDRESSSNPAILKGH